MIKHKLILPITMLATMLLPVSIFGQTISNSEFIQAQKSAEHFALSSKLQDVSKLKLALKDIEKYETRLLATERVFRLLTAQPPSFAHTSWLNSQLLSDDVLYIPNPDHPEQQLEVVNIAKQAKAVLAIWQYQEKAKTITEALASYRWQWPDFMAEQGKGKYAALSLALNDADKASLLWLQNELINSASFTQADNQLLVMLASLHASKALVAQVWKNEADQYSYQLLQGIEQLFAKEEAIKQLYLASHNSQLASQAILKLTTVFIDDDSVQNKLLALLNEKDTAWHVAMAVCSSQHEGMIDKIMQLGRESSAILYVKRCMKEVL